MNELLSTCLAIALLLAPACASDSGITSPDSTPNIILIITDDQDVPSIADMPSVRRHLIAPGITFDHAYATTPICCPQRTSVLRGQYSHNHGVKAVGRNLSGFKRIFESGGEASTIATWLDSAGYQTFFAGKYMNGYTGNVQGVTQTYVPPGWDRWFGDLAPQDYFNYRINDNGKVIAYGEEPEDYLTDVLARESIDFIRTAAGSAEPFFMYIAPFAPHDSPPVHLAIPAPRHADAFADRKAPRIPSFNEADVEDKSPYIRNRPLLTEEQIDAIDRQHRLRLQSLLAVDEMVEALFEALDETGKLDETYVFYTTDNGFHLGQHRVPKGKGLAYEEDIIVPLIVRGPGLPHGSRDHLVLLSDLAPTFVDLAGAEIPELVDGRSLVPLLAKDPPPLEDWRQAFLIEYWRPRPESPDALIWRGIRTDAYKYIEWSTSKWRELYDMNADPYELDNLYADGEPAITRKLAPWLDALFECAGATCRSLENAPPNP